MYPTTPFDPDFDALASGLSGEPWWVLAGRNKVKKDDIARAVSAKGEGLWRDDQTRRDEMATNVKRYTGRSMKGLHQSASVSPDTRLNVAKPAVDTLVSRIGSSKPRPRILTDGANYEVRERARMLQRFIDGCFNKYQIHSLTKEAFRDAMVCDAGVFHARPNIGKGSIEAERVFPGELLVDSISGIDRNPQDMFRVKFISLDVLANAVPSSLRAEVLKLPQVKPEDLPDYVKDNYDGSGYVRENCRMTRIYEAWHLADSALDGKSIPGRHVMAAGNILLLNEEWEHTMFPFAIYYYNKPMRGFWGESAVGEIRGLEKEANSLLQKVQRAMRVAGQPWLLRHQDDRGLPPVTDEVGLELTYKNPNAKPEVVSFQPVHPALMNQVLQLRSLAFEQLGVNDQQIAAIKPAGIESGRGLEQLSEEGLVRFKDASQEYEQFVASDVTRVLILAAQQLDEGMREHRNKGFSLSATVGNEYAKMNWSDCHLDFENYDIQVWPASSLPLLPAARNEEVGRLLEGGLIKQSTAQQLLDLPDIDEERELQAAPSRFLDWQLCEMLEKGNQMAPSERQDLQLALQRGTYALLDATRRGADPERLALLETFLDMVEAKLTPPTPVEPVQTGVEALPADPALAGGVPIAPAMPAPAGTVPVM
jgi:hypothetical protein